MRKLAVQTRITSLKSAHSPVDVLCTSGESIPLDLLPHFVVPNTSTRRELKQSVCSRLLAANEKADGVTVVRELC